MHNLVVCVDAEHAFVVSHHVPFDVTGASREERAAIETQMETEFGQEFDQYLVVGVYFNALYTGSPIVNRHWNQGE